MNEGPLHDNRESFHDCPSVAEREEAQRMARNLPNLNFEDSSFVASNPNSYKRTKPTLNLTAYWLGELTLRTTTACETWKSLPATIEPDGAAPDIFENVGKS